MIRYWYIKIKNRILKRNYKEYNNELSSYYRKAGMTVGEKCCIYSNILTGEAFLIYIGDNVSISNGVQLITHDNSVSKLFSDQTDIFGEIHIGDNCFIGAHTLILPGVSIAKNVIVAAGSVVTKSINESDVIYAGNPAKKIKNTMEFKNKIKDKCFSVDNLSYVEKKKLIEENAGKLIKR